MPRIATLASAVLLLVAPLAHGQDAPSPARHTDSALAAEIERLADGFGGVVGVYVRHLGTGATVEMRADETFPTASLIKIPILLTLFEQVERGEHDLYAELPYPDTLTYAHTESTDVVGYMRSGDTLPLRQLAFLMLSTSDNHASLWLQALVGGGAVVNEWLGRNGYTSTRVNSRVPGREEIRSVYGWGQTTPREIAEMMASIREGRAVSPAASERMYRMLGASFWNEEGLSQVPPTVNAASKQGFVSRSRSEVLLVNAPGGDYVVAVITREQEDTSHGADNEGFRLIRAVSRAVYRHFNPDDSWKPAGHDHQVDQDEEMRGFRGTRAGPASAAP